ncbi:MAG: hypothetical protein MJ002_09010 [Paludibacteraceae bacterium]|nr:hypothetical protein [Paludibacteraceae bacterium]
MDRLRRWLVELKEGKAVFVVECCEMADVYGEGIKVFEDYVDEAHRRMKSDISEVTDEECEAFYERWSSVFMERDGKMMNERWRRYADERKRSVFGQTMEFLELQLRGAVRDLMECCCVNECQMMINDDAETMNGYRRELGGETDDVTLRKYAFFRRFFGYEQGRYQLTEKVMIAKHIMLNFGDWDDERIMTYFECYGMMAIIQMDMDDLCVGEEHRLSGIRSFDPYAVLEYVERVGRWTRDAAAVRKIWVELVLRSKEIVRVSRGIEVECFEEKNGDFSKIFVAALIGVMKSKYGLYSGTCREMAMALEMSEAARERVVRYMNGMFGKIKVTAGSRKVIERVVGH